MKIVIIGGGITGLTTAHALIKKGISCTVFERSPVLNEVGAGIMIQPNALAVLDYLGIGNVIRDAGQPLEQAVITNHQFKPIRKTSNKIIKSNSGLTITGIHRARLQGILADTLPKNCLHLGESFEFSVENKDDIRVVLSNTSVNADIVLAADGIHSAVRKQLFPNSQIRYAKQTCWRGISDFELPLKYKNWAFELWGNKQRFGIAPISPTETYWFAVQTAPSNGKDNLESLKEDLLSKFANFDSVVKDIITSTNQHKIIRNDIFDLKRLPNWYSGRTCLIGDAAHATTPNMGQGAAQGIEDAFYISNLLQKYSDPKDLFPIFQAQRRKKVDYIVNSSWRFGQWAHNPILQPILKMAMKVIPESLMQKQLESIYSLPTE